MSDGAIGTAPETAPPETVVTVMQAPSARPKLKLMVPTIALLVYWAVTEASYQLEMGMFYRFVTRMVALLLLLLFFLVWGLTRRHFTLGQRLIALTTMMGTMLVGGAVGHPATGTMATAMMGLPLVITLSILWLWGTRQRGARAELAGIGNASVLVFGVISLLRWDGLDGRQRAELSWRWTPNPEEQFLREGTAPVTTVARPKQEVLEESTADWSSFRGGSREGVVPGVQLGDWSQSAPRERWRRRVGPGWSSVIAVGDYLFTQEQRGGSEAVVCYSSATGDEVWVHLPEGVSERFDDSLSGTGPRATPTFHESRIYAYGAKGRLECLDAVTGKSHWFQALFALTGAAIPQWGAATSPTIVDDLVVVFVGGKKDNSLLAFDRLTGKLRWQTTGGSISYSSPQVMTVAGERQIVIHDDAGLNGVRIEDGKVLWSHASPNAGSFQPMLQPHQIGDDRLLVNWDSGLLCLQLHHEGGVWRSEEIWKSNRLKPSFNDFVIFGEHIYGLDDGILCCVDLKQGQRLWKRGRYGFGQLLLLPDVRELLILSERGEVIRVAADPQEHRELGQFKAIEGKTWNHPILAHGSLIVRNGEEMASFDVAIPAAAKSE